MSKNKKISEEYLDYYTKYVKKFGEKTIVLMQVGSFYEVYAVLIKDIDINYNITIPCINGVYGPDLNTLEDLTDICIAHKGTDKSKYNFNNPYLWGFPIVADNKYITILIDNGYTIVMISQYIIDKQIKRKVSSIYSPGTYLESTYRSPSNFIANIYIEEIQRNDELTSACFGMSAIDVSTGEVYIHESYSKTNDNKYGLDDTLRFLNGISPKEIIIYRENIYELSNEKIIEYFALTNKLYQFRDPNKKFNKINYQKKLLSSIYSSENSMINIIDVLNLSQTIYACKSLIHLLTYVYDHYNSLTKELNKPEFYFHNTNLFLGNDAINQLSIIGSNNDNLHEKNNNIKINCLMDVINKAKTGMGKRFIKMRFISPLTNANELNKIYSIVELIKNTKLINDENLFISLSKLLNSVHDIERLFRKIVIGILHPSQMIDFINSFKNIYKIMLCIKKQKNIFELFNVEKNITKEIKELNNLLFNMINIDKAKLFRLHDIRENIFNKNIYKDLDILQLKIGDNHILMLELLDNLNEMIDDSKSKKIILKQNKQKGYYYQTTLKRYEQLNKKLKTIDYIEISDNKKIRYDDFIILKKNNVVEISLSFLKNQTDSINDSVNKMIELTQTYYTSLLTDINKNFGTMIKKIINIITLIDYYTTIAKISNDYNYIKPEIIESDFSNMNVINLRHPIVERIIDYEYIPHSINIGNDIKGMLLYGLNSAGKSVLMKAIGIAIIMAQSGFYVPADKFIFSPYKTLYTRITSNDNLFRGMSSYVLEMNELNAILKRSDNFTLVIGDEVCRGTEHISGNSIVAASLLKLSNLGSSFVFATHLHELMNLDIIKNKTNIKAFHLSVICNEKDDLIYDRLLKDGSGERIYGITVAKSIIKDLEFIKMAYDIKNQLLNQNINSPVIDTKVSHFNSKLLMDKCDICGEKNNLETHHINQQKNCINGFIIDKQHIKKNHLSNLIVLCRNCHNKIHSENIQINGVKMTNIGKKIIL